jgi:ATP-dependent helicase HrpB
MAWIDPPPAAAMAAARAKLSSLGALEGDRITDHGRAMASLPMGPEQAHMLLYGAARGGETAAMLAFLLQERGLGGRGEDLLARLDRWRTDRSPKAEAARQMARQWGKRAENWCLGWPVRHRLRAFAGRRFSRQSGQRRDASGEEWIAAGGRGWFLTRSHPWHARISGRG